MVSSLWSSVALRPCRTRLSLFLRQYSAAGVAAAAQPEQTFDPGASATPVDTVLSNMQGQHFHTLKGKVTDDTLNAITTKPFRLTHMTAVQEQVLGLLPDLASTQAERTKDHPRDLLVRAKTGTGKTLAFLVPAIEARIRAIAERGERAVKDAGLVNDSLLQRKAETRFARETVGTLILSPTRELATQIANEALRLSYHHKGFEVRLFTGGTSKMRQIRDWMKGRRDIVVATTGRLRDVLSTEPVVADSIKSTKTLILDEADTMLDMGFRDDIAAIDEYLAPKTERQTFLFSATIPPALREVTAEMLSKDHKYINTVPKDESPVHAHIPQYSTVLPSGAHQLQHIMKLLAHEQMLHPAGSKTIVFFPTTKMTQLFSTLVRELKERLLPAGQNTRVYELHSKRDQNARASTSDQFRNEKHSHAVLITSDVSARGVDYPGVTRVIQIGIPASSDQYIHRVGRTGRAGSNGRGDLILLPWEIGFLTWQLTDVPIKSVSITELNNQLKEAFEAYDKDAKAYLSNLGISSSGPKFDKRGQRLDSSSFSKDLSLTLDEFPVTINELVRRLDEEAVRETFLSLLGYYISKSSELRTHREVVLQGLRDWTTDALGLNTPPYVSQAFLQKMGFEDNRTKRFGMAPGPNPRFAKKERSHHWLGRGEQRTRDLPRPQKPELQFDESEEGLNPLDYKTPRYGDYRKPWRQEQRRSRNRDQNQGQAPPRERRGGFGLTRK